MTNRIHSRRALFSWGACLGLVATLAQGCGLVEVRGVPGMGSAGASSSSGKAPPGTGEKAESTKKIDVARAYPFDAARYEKCSAEFDKDYDAWLPIDAEAKAVLAKVQGQSAYVSIPALVRAYAVVEEKRAVRQDGRVPTGAAFAPATKVELARALMKIGVENGTGACVDRQLSYEPMSDTFRPPLTGDRAKDKIETCGVDDPVRMQAREEGRRAMFEEERKLSQAYHYPPPVGGMFGRVRSLESKSDELVLKIDELASDYKCVPNGRYGMVGGTWGPLCDYVDLPPNVPRPKRLRCFFG